jgi:hypothetical protein
MVASRDRLERTLEERCAAQIDRDPPSRVVGGLDLDAAVVLPVAVALILKPPLQLL